MLCLQDFVFISGPSFYFTDHFVSYNGLLFRKTRYICTIGTKGDKDVVDKRLLSFVDNSYGKPLYERVLFDSSGSLSTTGELWLPYCSFEGLIGLMFYTNNRDDCFGFYYSFFDLFLSISGEIGLMFFDVAGFRTLERHPLYTIRGDLIRSSSQYSLYTYSPIDRSYKFYCYSYETEFLV